MRVGRDRGLLAGRDGLLGQEGEFRGGESGVSFRLVSDARELRLFRHRSLSLLARNYCERISA